MSPCNGAAVRLSKARDQGQGRSFSCPKKDRGPVQIDKADIPGTVVRRSPCPESKPHERNGAGAMVGQTANVEN